MLTINSDIKSVTATLNMGSNLKEVAKEIGVNEKRLSEIIKAAGYEFKENRWTHKDYESPMRDLTVKEFIDGKVPFTFDQLGELTRLIDKRILAIHKFENKRILNELDKLGPIKRTSKYMGADENLITEFEQFCDDYSLIKSRALSLALNEFLDKYAFNRATKEAHHD